MTEQNDRNENAKQPPEPMSREVAEIILQELHSFGADLRNLITEREDRIETLRKQNRESLAQALASVVPTASRK